MVCLTTVALIERRVDISRSLFTRYWRDVHGVMAARIPGFKSYTQYHVTPLAEEGSSAIEPFEGVAIVTFATEQDRAGLATSSLSKHIRRDEQNVFKRALLYNLEPGSSSTRPTGDHPPAPNLGNEDSSAARAAAFLLAAAEAEAGVELILTAMGTRNLIELHTHDLGSGDPAAWNRAELDDRERRRFGTLIHGIWASAEGAAAAIRRAIDTAQGNIAAYRVDAMYVMVESGTPTPLGLRGWDALQTITEAGAVNQLDPAVLEAIYPRAET